MSRTYRNRRATPPGTRLCDSNGFYKLWGPDGHIPWERTRMNFRGWYKETKENRKMHQRQYRAQVRAAMLHERYEDIPRWRKTCGWLSW